MMKNNLLLFLFISVNMLTRAQHTPEALISNLPKAPVSGEVCQSTSKSKEAFRDSVSAYEVLVEQLLNDLRENQEKESTVMQQQAIKKKSADYNLTPEEMEKLQQEDLSDEEAQALADKILQKNYNISLDETETVSKKSEKGQNAWGEGYSREVMAESEANPEKNKETVKKNMTLAEMASAKTELNKKLMADEKSIAGKFSELDSNKSALILKKEIDALEKELAKEEGNYTKSDSKKLEDLRAQILSKKKMYCTELSPAYLELLNKNLTLIKGNMSSYYRLEELTNKVNQANIGSTVAVLKKGEVALQYIKGYISRLKNAYKYSLYDNDREFLNPIFDKE